MPNNLQKSLLIRLNTQISKLCCASFDLEQFKQKPIREL